MTETEKKSPEESRTLKLLVEIAEHLSKKHLPTIRRNWWGADVAITDREPAPPNPHAFYPPDRFVVTSYPRELSWLFVQLRDAFYAEELIDFSNKEEFFGRLGNAAELCIKERPNVTPHLLLAAVLREAHAIYDEIKAGEFGGLPIVMWNEIHDDSTPKEDRNGFKNIEETISFFAARGVKIHGVSPQLDLTGFNDRDTSKER